MSLLTVTGQGKGVALLAEGVDRNWLFSSAYLAISPVALLAEGVDRNFEWRNPETDLPKSPSSRRAWIEMLWSGAALARMAVALLAEGVDRNTSGNVTYTATTSSPSSRRAWIEIFMPSLRP